MSVLYFALAIYIIGVAIMLYIRPSTMFHPDNGTWKEFGLDNGPRSTVFPFWMFTIVWAFMSYAIATVGNVFLANLVLSSTPGDMFTDTDIATPISEEVSRVRAPRIRAPRVVNTPAPVANTESLFTMPSWFSAPTLAPAPAPAPTAVPAVPATPAVEPVKLPGYYFVEPQPSGIPRFVYFGHEPPTFENLVAHS